MSRQSLGTDKHPTYTILVVEDELMVRLPIAEYLRDCGYNVLEASDASEAIAAAGSSGPVNVVFTDVRMPGNMDGFELAQWFHANHPRVPVLLTSGFNSRRGRHLDAAARFGLIEKPYSQIQVEKRIAALLR